MPIAKSIRAHCINCYKMKESEERRGNEKNLRKNKSIEINEQVELLMENER